MTSGGSGPAFGPVGTMRSWLRQPSGDAGQQKSLGTRVVSWVIFIAVSAYFVLPLVATFLHSIKPVINGVPDPTLAY